MATYPSGGGSNIGTLLRLIQEDQNKSIAATPPAAEADSPLRGVIQGPLKAPESPGSERVISLRPEGVTQSGPQAGVSPVAPVAPGGGAVAGGVVAPIRPTPVFAPQASGQPNSAPSSPSPVSNSSAVLGSSVASRPSLGTTIRPSTVTGQASSARYTPAKPAPAKSFSQPSTSKSGGSQGAFGGTVSSAGAGAKSLLNVLGSLGKFGAGVSTTATLLPKNVVDYLKKSFNPKGAITRT